MTWFDALVAIVSVVAAAIASVAGFGIGSLLTATFGVRVSTNVAVAAVSIPHLAGTALRFWMMRKSVDRRVLLSFGLTSAAGGLTGALLQHWTGSASAIRAASAPPPFSASMSGRTHSSRVPPRSA